MVSSSSSRIPSSPRQRQDKDQRVVQTPYGRGLVVKTRTNDSIQEVELLDWKPARTTNKPPVLYSPQSFSSVAPLVGDDVVCLFGRGRVLSVDEASQKCLVQLTSWRLAQRSTVNCYLSIPTSVSVVRKKTLYEMNCFEKVEYAQEEKNTATRHFLNKDYNLALEHYDRAVTSVRYVQHDANSTNELRADLLVVMITCCNNAGTCCSLLKEYDEAIKFAKNALVLLDALYEKRGLKIHSILNKEGLTDAKLFGEWRVKSLLIKANGYIGKTDYDEAMRVLKDAHHVIESFVETDKLQDPAYHQAAYATLYKQSKEVKRLRAMCLQQKKLQKKKEKQRAQAMFAASPTDAASKTSKSVKISEPASITKEARNGSKNAVLDMSEKVTDEIPTIRTKRSVSFSDDTKPGKDCVAQDSDEELPWYDEHKEALILSGIVGLAVLATVLLRGRK